MKGNLISRLVSVGFIAGGWGRYGVRQLNICGEKLSENLQEVLKFKAKFRCLIDNEGLSDKHIYNCDETGLNYKMLPSKTLASKAEGSAPGYA
jgi:hypothetical protein